MKKIEEHIEEVTLSAKRGEWTFKNTGNAMIQYFTKVYPEKAILSIKHEYPGPIVHIELTPDIYEVQFRGTLNT